MESSFDDIPTFNGSEFGTGKPKSKETMEKIKRIELFNKCMKVLPTLVDMEIAGYKLSTFEH